MPFARLPRGASIEPVGGEYAVEDNDRLFVSTAQAVRLECGMVPRVTNDHHLRRGILGR